MSLSTIVRANTYTNGSVADAIKVNENEETAYTAINTIIAAINDASGTKTSLDARLNVSLNEDGTLKDSITSGGAWINPGFTYLRVADNSFKIVGANHTDIYTEKRRLRLVLNGTTSYTHVTGSIYSLGDTTVTINDSIITSGLTIDSIEHSSVLGGVTNTNLPSDIEADTLDGQHGSYYRNADNINSGTLALDRMPTTLTGKDADTLDTYHAADLLKGNKNRIINGDFNVMQKSTAGPDLWKGITTPLTQQSHTVGQTSVPDNPTYYLRASGADSTMAFYTRIEDVSTFASQQYTLSFYAYSAKAKTMTVKLKQNFGSGGSTEVEAYSGTVSLTTGWTKFTITDTLDSISGKTVGAGNYLEVYFTASTMGANDFIYMSHVQLEKGAFASEFEFRPYHTELALCQRYFERISLNPGQRAHHTIGWIQTSNSAKYITTFRIPKRVPPPSIEFSFTSNGYPQIASGASTYIANTSFPMGTFTTTEYDTEYILSTGSTISQAVGSVARLLASSSYALYLDISAEL